MSNILSVSELTRYVKDLLEAEFPFVWVRGQVTNLARPGSGHIYFSLTDGDAILSVVWFKGSQMQAEPDADGESVNPLTGEVEESVTSLNMAQTLEDGMEILCAGRLNVYAPRGQYQLVAELVQPQGVGDLQMAFEALKTKLAQKGYFDEDRKMDLPRDPGRVAVITSPKGAAIRDFLRIAAERGTGAEVRIYPTLVQGDAAPAQIAEALDRVCEEGWAEVAVLIRGGGSLEDLWAYNTEPVADAIFRAQVPVLAGIGHEPDVSIADFVADKRAATPSHAAQELWPRRENLMQSVDRLEMELSKAYTSFLNERESEFAQLRKAVLWLSPMRRLGRIEDSLRSLMLRLDRGGKSAVGLRRDETARLAKRLRLAHGEQAVDTAAARLESVVRAMQHGAEKRLAQAGSVHELLHARLQGLDPEKPLERGYSLVEIEDTGRFLRDPREVVPGDRLNIRVKQGSVAAQVTDTRPETKEKE